MIFQLNMMMNDLPNTFVETFHSVEAVRKMKYQPLGKTGMIVSKLSFGKVQFVNHYFTLCMMLKKEIYCVRKVAKRH